MVARKFLLDTTVCISLLRRKEGLAEKLQSIGLDKCFISDITLAELYFGASKSEREKHFEDIGRIRSLFKILPSNVCYPEYGDIRWKLEKTGIKTGDMDLLIAATAIHFGLIVVTANTKHFERIPGIKLENWE